MKQRFIVLLIGFRIHYLTFQPNFEDGSSNFTVEWICFRTAKKCFNVSLYSNNANVEFIWVADRGIHDSPSSKISRDEIDILRNDNIIFYELMPQPSLKTLIRYAQNLAAELLTVIWGHCNFVECVLLQA